MNRVEIPILRIGSTLMVSIQSELHDRIVDLLQKNILLSIEKHSTNSVVIDISSLDFVDSYVARALVQTAAMAKLMGSETIIAGMRPEVAVTLIGMGFNIHKIKTALNVEEALNALKKKIKSEVEV